jgi:3-hydroxyacyl-CoA dehydrogenase
VENNWLGDKTGQGFFKKVKGAGGEKEIYTLESETLRIPAKAKAKICFADAAKPVDDLKQRLKCWWQRQDKAGEFYRHFHYGLFSYISRIPEISDEVYRIDDAMMAGFGWEIGAFESWDVLGVSKTASAMKGRVFRCSLGRGNAWPKGTRHFINTEHGKTYCYEPSSKSYKALPGGDAFIILEQLPG